jgi:hypothetical protein
MLTRPSVLSALVLLGACTYQGTPVPVMGDTRLLAGDWEGTYQSEETGRSGTINFSLKAGTDSAFGDVWMVPRQAEHLQHPGADPGDYRPPRALPRPLRISFVRCADGEVTGTLDPYEDPETGERIFTTFEGRIEGSTFSGRFVSLYQPSGVRARGTWSVTWKPARPAGL